MLVKLSQIFADSDLSPELDIVQSTMNVEWTESYLNHETDDYIYAVGVDPDDRELGNRIRLCMLN